MIKYNLNKDMSRNQSFELMRIVLMLAVIAHHLGIHGKVIESNDTIIRNFGMVIASGGQVAVIAFFMLYGYFAINGKFKIKRLVEIWLCIVEYGILACLLLGNITLESILSALLPVSSRMYNFMTNYILLTVLYPLLVPRLKKNSFKVYVGIVIIVGILINGIGSFLNRRYVIDSIIYPCFLAYIGSGLNIYKDLFTLNKYIKVLKWFPVFWVGGAIFIVLLHGEYWAKYIEFGNPLTVICAASIIWNFSIREANICWRKISKYTFGIFIFHENPYIRGFLWNTMLTQADKMDYGYIKYILYALFCIVIVFMLGMIIEMIRNGMMYYLEKEINKIIPINTLFKKVDDVLTVGENTNV